MNHTEDPLFIAEKDRFETYLETIPGAMNAWKALDDEDQFMIIQDIKYGATYQEAEASF